MPPRSLLFSIVFLGAAFAASAGVIEYQVNVNTGGIFGTAGSLDFQFNPGPLVSQSASVQILNFSSDGALVGGPSLTGDINGGPFPATVTFDNGAGFNDYFEAFTFGSTLSFDVSLYGPALSSPNGTSTSGSAFAFSMFSDGAGTIPVLTSNLTDGFAFTVVVNLDGTTNVTNSSAQTTMIPATGAIPEPGTFSHVALAIGFWIAFRFRLQRRRHVAFFETARRKQ
ncbi:MAG TPA: NF038129 family PEP-CTERM protein [Bryobacteraceae bacterium]|nr:NF038129 family PEP-CTERM protein [Bryobacteraceae bacterium]